MEKQRLLEGDQHTLSPVLENPGHGGGERTSDRIIQGSKARDLSI